MPNLWKILSPFKERYGTCRLMMVSLQRLQQRFRDVRRHQPSDQKKTSVIKSAGRHELSDQQGDISHQISNVASVIKSTMRHQSSDQQCGISYQINFTLVVQMQSALNSFYQSHTTHTDVMIANRIYQSNRTRPSTSLFIKFQNGWRHQDCYWLSSVSLNWICLEVGRFLFLGHCTSALRALLAAINYSRHTH